MNIGFVVHGKPATAGSKRAFALRRRDGSLVTRPGGAPVINVTDDNVRAKSWKQQVAAAAVEAMESAGLTMLFGPLAVTFTFHRMRPKTHFGSGKNVHVVKASAPPYPSGKPDVLKLARCAEDALTGVLWRDDAQIVDEHIFKRWSTRDWMLVSVSEAT